MLNNVRSRQRGISFIGLVFVLGVLAMTGVVLAQVFPTYLEFTSVTKAVNKAAAEGATVADVRTIFDKSAAVDDIKTISGRDLEVSKEADKVVVSFDYKKEIHLFGPAYLTMKYTGRSK